MAIPRKLGLVLGGGGARGLAHIGLLKVLENAQIPLSVIGGSSMGALIGAMYAQHPDAVRLEQRVIRFLKSPRYKELGIHNLRHKNHKDPDDILRQMARNVKRRVIINMAANRNALLKSERLRTAIDALIDDSSIESCKIRFVCTATDLISGDVVYLKSGSIRSAVESSSAIPGFIPPVSLDGYLLVDGSVADNFPIEAVRTMGANRVVAVDVSLDFEEDLEIDNVIDLVIRSAQISARHLDEHLKRKADLVIKPTIGNVHWSEFGRYKELIQLGEDAALRALPDIQQLRVERRGIKRFFKRNRG